MVGAVYAANTVGAIVGAIGFSIILIPTVGTLWAQRILIIAAAMAAVLILLTGLRADVSTGARRLAAVLGTAFAVVAAAVLAYGVPPAPGELYAFGRTIMNPGYRPKMLYVGEGMNASIAVSEDDEKARYFHVSGKTEAGSHPVDMRLQRMLGSLAVLLMPNPRSVLVVGFGAGVTAGTFVAYPEIERIVICEIEPLIPRMISGFFSEQNFDVVKNPRVEIVYDDARHFVLTSKEKFDIITSDPIHPWVKGVGLALYAGVFRAREAASQAGRSGHPLGSARRDHNRRGEERDGDLLFRLSGWNRLDQRSRWRRRRGAVRPGRSQAHQCRRGGGTIQSRRKCARGQGSAAMSASHRRSTCSRAMADMRPISRSGSKGAAINTDRDLRLQYLAGMGLNVDAQDQIYFELIEARQIPPGLFVGSAETLAELRKAIEDNKRRPGDLNWKQ